MQAADNKHTHCPGPARLHAFCLALLAGLAACGPDVGLDEDPSALVESWTVYARPAVTIGVVVGEGPYQLHEVRHAIKLDDGRIVIANSGSGEVRFYDAAGGFLFASGRLGDGPGEYRTVDVLFEAGGDTLIVADHRAERTNAVSKSTGEHLGLLADPEDAFPFDEWVHGDMVVGSPLGPAQRGAALAAVERLPAPSPGQERQFARVTREGLVWTTDNPRTARAGPTPWEIYDLEGTPVASAATPAGVTVWDMGPDWVLGMWKDTLGVEHVSVLEVERPVWDGPDLESAVAAGRRAPAFPRVPGSYTTALGGAIREFAIAQEVFYAERRNYASTIEQLGEVEGADYFQVPESVRLDYFARASDFWMIRGEDPEAGVTCFMAYGSRAIIGVPRGQIRCWSAGGA